MDDRVVTFVVFRNDRINLLILTITVKLLIHLKGAAKLKDIVLYVVESVLKRETTRMRGHFADFYWNKNNIFIPQIAINGKIK